MVEQGHPAPVLVGGAAAEIYSAGALATGDFDIVTPRQEAFEAILKELGFTKPEGLGHTPLGWVHADLRLGFEVVSSTLLGGLADRERMFLIDMAEDGDALVVSVEDMIADRMGQFASGTAPEMLTQARTLFGLHRDADLDYLDRRIRYETAGDFGVDYLAC